MPISDIGAVAVELGFAWTGLDWLTIFFEAPPESFDNVDIGLDQDRFTWAVQPV